MLKVGELAAAAGLTVRTLHHYDSIGLLSPSARSDAGYRLYGRDDVARLHQIQALRAFGMRLADIGLYLDSPDASPLAVVERQLAALERRIAEAARMRDALRTLRGRLAAGEQPDLSAWLTTLQEMSVYEHYFSKEELDGLPLYSDNTVKAQWRALVGEAQALLDAGAAHDAAPARDLARRWLDAFEAGSGSPAFAGRINAMAAREPQAMQAQFGLSPQLMGFVMAAIGELKYAVWARYLPADVVARMRRHHATRGGEWTALQERVRAAMQADPGATGTTARALARDWLALFHDMVGDDPQVVAAFRQASATEPLLRKGTGIGEAVLAWLRKAMPKPASAA
jgi:DNA-binding transcriptional MerR regulator